MKIQIHCFSLTLDAQTLELHCSQTLEVNNWPNILCNTSLKLLLAHFRKVVKVVQTCKTFNMRMMRVCYQDLPQELEG